MAILTLIGGRIQYFGWKEYKPGFLYFFHTSVETIEAIDYRFPRVLNLMGAFLSQFDPQYQPRGWQK